MVQDRLTKAVMRRLKELGLPPTLIDLGDFHDKLFDHHWVMYVRDHDTIADVHLVQPAKGKLHGPPGRSSERRAKSPPHRAR